MTDPWKETDNGGFRPIDNLFYFLLSWLFYGGTVCLGFSLVIGPLYALRFVDMMVLKVALVGVSFSSGAIILLAVLYFACLDKRND